MKTVIGFSKIEGLGAAAISSHDGMELLFVQALCECSASILQKMLWMLFWRPVPAGR